MPWEPADSRSKCWTQMNLTVFLSTIRRQLRKERSPFELAFNHTYQFYAEPMVMFTNTHDQLLVNVPILLRLATQKAIKICYSIDTVPMPFDTENIRWYE